MFLQYLPQLQLDNTQPPIPYNHIYIYLIYTPFPCLEPELLYAHKYNTFHLSPPKNLPMPWCRVVGCRGHPAIMMAELYDECFADYTLTLHTFLFVSVVVLKSVDL